MTSAWYFLEPLRNETQNFLISKLCFPWLVYTLTPSNSTHYYLTSAKLPFNTETTKKLPPEKKTTENLRTYSVTWKVLLVNTSAAISEHNSSFMIQIITGDWSSRELLWHYQHRHWFHGRGQQFQHRSSNQHSSHWVDKWVDYWRLATILGNSADLKWFGYAENVSGCSQWILFASSRVIKGTWVYKSYLKKDYEVLENYRYGKIVEVAWTAINCLSASTPHSTKLQKVRFPYSVVCPKTRLCSYRQPL